MIPPLDITGSLMNRCTPDLRAFQLRNQLQGLLHIGIVRFEAVRDAQFPLPFIQVPGPAVDQAKIFMQVAFRLPIPTDLHGFFELSHRLVPIAGAGRRESEIAQRVGAFRDAPSPFTAGVSATTTNGPCKAMFRYGPAGCGMRGTAPDRVQCAVNGASTPGRAAQPRLGLAFAAVMKGRGHDRVDARGIERGLHGIAVDRIADQALAEQRIGSVASVAPPVSRWPSVSCRSCSGKR